MVTCINLPRGVMMRLKQLHGSGFLNIIYVPVAGINILCVFIVVF